MSESLNVKLFSLDRMARFNRDSDQLYIVPGEIVSIMKFDDREVWIEYGVGRSTRVNGTLQDVEDEVNRALGATYAAHLQAAKEAGERVESIMKKLNESEDENVFNMNDFIPKRVN